MNVYKQLFDYQRIIVDFVKSKKSFALLCLRGLLTTYNFNQRNLLLQLIH